MAGETALARQLKKLAVPQTTVLIHGKIRRSFLFDHRDAAGLDNDLIFSYGTNGIEKLCIINPQFSKFESNLFNLSYKDFQRSVQSKEVNAKLDAIISEFLKMLSPYLLIRAAHEALEWLIYRFHIHMYNVDDLVASALPYYNSSAFVRVIQLLDLNEGSRWFWLKPVQNSEMQLDYSAILNRFIADRGFRKFVCDIAPNVLSVYKENLNIAVPIMSFSMLTIYNALSKCKSVDDKFITLLFPYILEGLASNFSKYTAASYLIISRLVVKVKLTPDIVEELLIKIFQTITDDLNKEAFQLLLLIFQNQLLKQVPKKVNAMIILNSRITDVLFSTSEEFDAHNLIKTLMKRNLSCLFTNSYSNVKMRKKSIKFLKNILTNIKLSEKTVKFCFDLLLNKVIKHSRDKNSKQHYKKIAKLILKCLERRYPDCFDKAFKNFLVNKPKKGRKIICDLINDSVCSIKHKVVPNVKTSLVVGLYHVNSDIRKNSVNHLLKLIQEGNVTEQQFIENSLYDRLLDKSPKIVLAVLSSPENILKLIDKSKLIVAFKEIFSKNLNLKSKWHPVLMKCLEVIVKYFGSEENSFDILPLIVKYVFYVNEHTVEGFLYLLGSDISHFFIEELKILKSEIDKNNMNNEKYLEINCKIIESLKKCIDKMNDTARNDLILYIILELPTIHCYSLLSFYLYAVQHIIFISTENYRLKYLKHLLQILGHYFAGQNVVFENFKGISDLSVIKNSLVAFENNEFPTSLAFAVLKTTVTDIKINLDNRQWPDIDSYNYRILNTLFNFCTFYLYSNQKILNEYFKSLLSLFISHQFKDITSVFDFSCTKWVAYKEEVPETLKFISLKIAIDFCKNQEHMNWLFENEAIFFCLLKAIFDENSSISHSALYLLHFAVNCSKICEYPLKYLAEELCMKSEEIKIDYKLCPEYVGNWLKPGAQYINSNTIQPSKIEKELQLKKLILEKILKLLIQENVPNIIKHFLLLCFHGIDSETILSAFVPMLNNFLSKFKIPSENKTHLLGIIELLVKKFNISTAKCLVDNAKESKALLDCLKYNNEDDPENSVQKFTLAALNKDFFAAIPSIKVQQEILQVLLELYITSSTNLNAKIGKVLRKLCTYAYLFLKDFQEKELGVSKSTTLREAKKSKIDKDIGTFTTFEKDSWKKMTVFLEIMQNKSELLKKEILITELFNLLNKTLDFESQAPVEYVRQLILSAIYSCCQQLGSERLNERQFQVELIVQCIRSSTNSKTHHQSLILLNLAARMFPDYVLSNVMSIFTFMGSSLVRQDDSYSFQVISQTIETIVPSLLEASNQQTEMEGIQVVAAVIRVFVDSLTDIPSHRQLPLFTKLISTLDPSKYLWIPLGQICDQYATVFHDIMTDNSANWKVSPLLEFAVNLHKQFSPDIQIDTCIALANFLSMLPDTKQQLESNLENFTQFKEPFNVSICSDKQLQIYKRNVLSYMKIWLLSQEFLSQVSELNLKEQLNLEQKYESLLGSVLSLLQSRLSAKLHKIEDQSISSQVQVIYDLIHAINSLLPCTLFIRVIKRLLKNEEVDIQVKAIEFLNVKLEQQQDLIRSENHKALQKLLRPLLKLLNKCLNEDSGNSKTAIIQQTALYALHLLCKLIGPDYPTKFHKVLNVTVQILNCNNQPELTVNALLCLAQLCSVLNVDILPHLNSFMPIIVNILQDKVLNMNECLILGVVAALQSIIGNLGMFLSSYMEATVTGICKSFVTYTELGKKAISEKFENLQSKIASEIPLRVLLTAIQISYSKVTSKTVNIVVPLMKILTEKLNSSTYEEILSSAPELQKFYVSLLDFRNCNENLPIETTAQIENSIISSFETFVMKLSVTRFGTLFQKVQQWATTPNEDQEQKLRIYTFYKLTCQFSKSLKSLFTQMSKYFFRDVAKIIDSINISKSKTVYFEENVSLSHKLLLNAIDTLNSCFMYAGENFLDKENFDTLMQPLVDQIENLGNETQYQDLIENHLSSCIAYFMSAVSDNTMWKALNYQILLKTRHDSPRVRFGSLQVIQEVVNKMGDNYLVLLPESIPFLAEIMEDESTEVEEECQNVIIEMEKILGEPIRKYF